MRILFLTLLFSVLRFGIVTAQVDSTSKSILKSMNIAEVQPSFTGKNGDFQLWLTKHFKVPKESRGFAGRLYVSFTVMPSGALSEIEFQGGPDDANWKQALTNTILKSPKWIPGTRNGKVVPMNVTMAFHHYDN